MSVINFWTIITTTVSSFITIDILRRTWYNIYFSCKTNITLFKLIYIKLERYNTRMDLKNRKCSILCFSINLTNCL